MSLSPTAIDRYGRPLRGAAHPDYWKDERERARQGGRELRLLDEAEHAAALAVSVPEPAPLVLAPPLRPRKINVRERVLCLLRVAPRTAAELAVKVYGRRASQYDQRVYKLLANLQRDGLVTRASRRWHVIKLAQDGWPVCPHCGQKVKG